MTSPPVRAPQARKPHTAGSAAILLMLSLSLIHISRGLAAQVDLSTWEPPPIFKHLQKLGALEIEEMLRTFNMGIGLVAVVPATLLKKARVVLTRMNERSLVMGRVIRKNNPRVVYS